MHHSWRISEQTESFYPKHAKTSHKHERARTLNPLAETSSAKTCSRTHLLRLRITAPPLPIVRVRCRPRSRRRLLLLLRLLRFFEEGARITAVDGRRRRQRRRSSLLRRQRQTKRPKWSSVSPARPASSGRNWWKVCSEMATRCECSPGR